MSYIDLHTHTTYSDGTYTPKNLVECAHKNNIKSIAITDHDTLDGISEAMEFGEKNNTEVISGIEISTDFGDKEIHVVGLFMDNTNKELCDILTLLHEKRKKRNILMTEKLNNLGIKISYSELEEISNGKIITRGHFARIMTQKGYTKSIRECFIKYLSEGCPAYIKREVISADETLRLIKNAGGLPILAHPLIYKLGNEKLHTIIKYLKNAGLIGMECYYPTHTERDTAYLLSICKEFDILPSGGSDFHGDNKPGLKLGTGYGNLTIPENILDDLKNIREMR